MSSIFSELVADVVLERCRAATESQKYLIGSVLGVPAAELYVALADRADTPCRVQTGPDDGDYWEMNAIRLENQVTIVPYLVSSSPAAGGDPNAGNRGFNGKLRDWFDRDDAADGVRVLVTFDEDPIETQKSAMDEGLRDGALSPAALLNHLRQEVSSSASHAVRPLLNAVLAYVASRRDLSAPEITRSVHVLRSAAQANTENEVGEELVELPWLLRDPAIDAGTAASRFKLAESHRVPLDGWAGSPDSDFEDEVRGKYDDNIAAQLLAARNLGTVQWEQFTLDELQGGLRGGSTKKAKNRLSPAEPSRVVQARASQFRLTGGGSDPRYGLVALVNSESVTVQLNLTRALADRETVHLITYMQEGEGYTKAATQRISRAEAEDQTEIRFEVDATPLAGKWFFCEAVLTEGSTYVKRYLGRVDFALLVDASATALPYEASCDIDASEQRFVVADEPQIMTVTPGGEVLPVAPDAITSEGEEGEDFEELLISADGGRIGVPVRYQIDEETERPVESGELSAEHARLRFAAAEDMTVGSVELPPLAFMQGVATVTVGGRESALLDVPELGRSRWNVESEILTLPELTNYRLGADGVLDEDTLLQRLSMSDELQGAFDRFMTSRNAFFGEVRERAPGGRNPTILSIPLAPLREAADYVEAYAALLETVPEGINWRAEYERLLLIDSVRPDGSDAVLVAPTSPLAVASHMQFQAELAEWADEPSTNLAPGDPDLVSPRFAVPLLRIGNTWYETRFAAYPWRIYASREQADEAHSEPFLPAFIARRINAFMHVHPLYRDRRRTLALAFVNPGDGAYIRDALFQLVKSAAGKASPELDKVPQFEVKLFAGDESADESAVERLGVELDQFMTATQESGAPSWPEQELMRRLTYTKGRLDEYIADAAAFSHLAFVHNYFRPGQLQTYELTERPLSTYGAGTATDLERASEVQANDVSFSSGLWLGHDARNTQLKRIIGRSAEIIASATGNPVTENRGIGVLTRVSKHTIPALYDRAAWVVHLDRHIGLELFYPQSESGQETPYILDHTDQENLQESGFDAITATTMVDPYLSLIASIFGELVDGMDPARAARMLRWLNLLSGRWALQLLQETPNAVKERLAAVVAFRFLDMRERIFEPGDHLALVVSLDELLRVTGKEGLALAEGWAAEFGHKGAASDDLLLLSISLQSEDLPRVAARVIEVKYSDGAPPTQKAWEQINATEQLLRRMFATAGPGLSFRGRVLAKLIRSYVARLASYGLLPHDIETAPDFVRTLDQIASGRFEFDSCFTRSGEELTGDFFSIEPNYTEPLYSAEPYSPESDPDKKIGRVRIGISLIQALIDNNKVAAQEGNYDVPQYECGKPAGPEAATSPDPASETEAEGAGRVTERSEIEEEAGAEPRLQETAGSQDGELAQPGEPPEPPEDEGGGGEAEGSEQALEGTGGTGEGATAAELSLRDRFAVPPSEMLRLADRLDQIFATYGLPVQPFNVEFADAGPNVIRFRSRMLEAGTIGSIEARGRDIHRELGIEDPVYIGQEPPFVVVDVPRLERATITFEDVLPALEATPAQPGELPVVMGVGSSGDIQIADLADMPHLLVAGSTGSGKSVFLSTIGVCLGRLPLSRVELIVIDIKGLDFVPFRKLPHTRGGAPIEDPAEAIEVLRSLMDEEVSRGRALFRASGARQIIEHYRLAPEEDWPRQIVVMIDEYAQLATASGTSRASLESLVQQYAQYARAFGIYLVLATQRPSVDVITGRIKANLPARCVFRLPSFNDSRTVIDTGGAEKLLGSGDMLFYREGAIQRLQTVFTAASDFDRVAERRQ